MTFLCLVPVNITFAEDYCVQWLMVACVIIEYLIYLNFYINLLGGHFEHIVVF